MAGDGATDGSRNSGRMGVGPGICTAKRDLSHADLECHSRRPQWLAFVRAVGRARAADFCRRRTGARGDGPSRVSENLPVSAKPVIARRRTTACDGGQGARNRPRAHPAVAHRPGGRAPGIGAGRRVREHGIRRRRRRRSHLRFSGHRPARLESRAGARSAVAGHLDDAGNAGHPNVECPGRHAGRKAERGARLTRWSLRLRQLAWIFLALLFLAALFSNRIAGASYAHQFRDFPGAPISWRFPLGTDALGRDRLARLLAATRISLLLAPAAAAFSTALATLIGGIAGYCGGFIDRVAARAIDLMLSLPWIFLLIAARALLPLNVSPATSVLVTFALLGALGWAAPARVIRAGVRDMRDSDFLLQARACGCRGFRLLLRQLAPNVKPVLLAQFRTSIPLFILSEANLGLLGLGVSDPLPSWGNLLRELETDLAFNPGIVACLALMLAVMGCFRLLLPSTSAPTD